jgi:hypothetical protein
MFDHRCRRGSISTRARAMARCAALGLALGVVENGTRVDRQPRRVLRTRMCFPLQTSFLLRIALPLHRRPMNR